MGKEDVVKGVEYCTGPSHGTLYKVRRDVSPAIAQLPNPLFPIALKTPTTITDTVYKGEVV